MMIVRLQAFYDEHGHTMVTRENCGGDLQFLQWTLSLRRNYRHQSSQQHQRDESSSSSLSTRRRNYLSPAKFQMLQDLKFPWDRQAATWGRRYLELRAFHERYGHCRVPPNNSEFPGLGVWVKNQRREYKRLLQAGLEEEDGITSTRRIVTSTLSQARLEALLELGFEWQESRKEAWETRYRDLVDYYNTHGHTDVPEDYPENPALGHWCMNQRTAYRAYVNGKQTAMTSKRIKALEALQFRFKLREYRWKLNLERLKEYYELHGHVTINPYDETNRSLRIWLIRQRFHYQRRKEELSSPMTAERIMAMESTIPDFKWKARGDNGPSSKDWAKLFDAMREKGIQPGSRPKQHWFEGINPFKMDVKDTWSEADLLELWNQEDEDEYEEGEDNGMVPVTFVRN